MNHPFVNLLVRWLILALGVALAAAVVPGIHYDTGWTLAVVVVLLSFCNAVLKPLLMLFTLPFIILTLGIGVWLINAFLILIVGRLVDGFHVSGFGSALLGAAILSVTNLVVSRLIASPPVPPRGPPMAKDDVIDV